MVHTLITHLVHLDYRFAALSSDEPSACDSRAASRDGARTSIEQERAARAAVHNIASDGRSSRNQSRESSRDGRPGQSRSNSQEPERNSQCSPAAAAPAPAEEKKAQTPEEVEHDLNEAIACVQEIDSTHMQLFVMTTVNSVLERANEYVANNENDDMERTGRTLSDEIGKEMKDNTEVKLDHMMNEISSRLTKRDITDQEHSNSEVIETSEAEKDMRKHENDIVSIATVYSSNASHKDNIKVWQENTREYGDGSVNENEAMFEGYGECDDMFIDWNTRNRRRRLQRQRLQHLFWG